MIRAGDDALTLHRVPLAGIEGEGDAVGALMRRLSAAMPPSNAPVIALIDSPRWPSDCDSRAQGLSLRSDHNGGRRIDGRLRELIRTLAANSLSDTSLRLSLFPTPRHDYFLRCIGDRACKPHLRALGHQLFELEPARPVADGPRGGAIFTRFMLSGFAAYRALEAIGVTAFEAYPDLQFRLWRDGRSLASKSAGRAAFTSRLGIITALAATLKLAGANAIRTPNQADAAILALSARAALERGAIGLIEEPEEGCFALPLQTAQALALGLTDTAGEPQGLTFGQQIRPFVSVETDAVDAHRLR